MEPHSNSIGLRSRLSTGLFHQLTLLGKEVLNILACVLGIIVLEEPMLIWILRTDEWHKGSRKYITILCRVHYATEKHNVCSILL